MVYRTTSQRRVLLSVVCVSWLAGCPILPPCDNQTPSQQILDMEQDAFDLVNQERVNEGLEPLLMDESVRTVGRAHSRDMAARDFFDHVNPDGDGPAERLHDAGISYTLMGENIAWSNYPNPITTVVDAWMDSPGHQANILHAGFTHTGMGVAADGSGGYYFTQDFVTFSKDGAPGPTTEYCPIPLAVGER